MGSSTSISISIRKSRRSGRRSSIFRSRSISPRTCSRRRTRRISRKGDFQAMATTRTHVGVPWDGRTAYERWVEDDLRLDLHRGYSGTSLKTVPVKPWAERGISAAFYDIIGAESLAGMYVGKIAPGQSSNPARQLCDEVIFVLAGRGSTSVETARGPISFEWGPRSLFAIPLNFRYRLHNNSGREPARFVSVNTIPIVYNLFRDPKFVFGCDWDF